MNQILSVDEGNKGSKRTKKAKSSGPIEISKVTKFFAISLIVLGVFMIGTGSYAMVKNQTSVEETKQEKPMITVESTSESTITLKVNHTAPLQKVVYYWNGEEETTLEGNDQNTIEQTISMPTGTNTLKVIASDIKGNENTYQKTYTLEGNIKIDVEKADNNIKIIAEGRDELSYMTYRWDEEEETRVEINDVTKEEIIEVPKGNHTLTVVVVDVNNKTETQKKEVVGTTKPKLEITTDGSSNFIIKTSDEQGLKKIEFVLNGKKYKLDLDGRTELEYAYPFEEGENLLEVTVYNQNDASEVKKVKVTLD